MFAVIRTGGKQYRVSENACIEVERLAGNPGDTLTFDDVMARAGTDPKARRFSREGRAAAALRRLCSPGTARTSSPGGSSSSPLTTTASGGNPASQSSKNRVTSSSDA